MTDLRTEPAPPSTPPSNPSENVVKSATNEPADSPAPKPPAPAPLPTARQQLGGFLKYVGPLVTIAGGLAMIRLWTIDWFFVALMPIGAVMWYVGWRLSRGG